MGTSGTASGSQRCSTTVAVLLEELVCGQRCWAGGAVDARFQEREGLTDQRPAECTAISHHSADPRGHQRGVHQSRRATPTSRGPLARCAAPPMAPLSPSKMVNESSDYGMGSRSSEGGYLEFFLTPTDKRNLAEWVKPVRARPLARPRHDPRPEARGRRAHAFTRSRRALPAGGGQVDHDEAADAGARVDGDAGAADDRPDGAQPDRAAQRHPGVVRLHHVLRVVPGVGVIRRRRPRHDLLVPALDPVAARPAAAAGHGGDRAVWLRLRQPGHRVSDAGLLHAAGLGLARVAVVRRPNGSARVDAQAHVGVLP